MRFRSSLRAPHLEPAYRSARAEDGGPRYIDVSDRHFAEEKFWVDPDIDIYLCLLEPDSQPPQVGPTQIHLIGSGDETTAGVYVGPHELGCLLVDDLAGFVAAQRAGASECLYAQLYEFRDGVPEACGAELELQNGRLSVWFGRHCFGVSEPKESAEFLRRAGVRLREEAASNVVSIQAARVAMAKRGRLVAAAI